MTGERKKTLHVLAQILLKLSLLMLSNKMGENLFVLRESRIFFVASYILVAAVPFPPEDQAPSPFPSLKGASWV